MTVFHVVAALLAVGRLTEIITQDRISERFRKWWPLYLWTCPRCVSVWAGIFATAMFYFAPFLNWPLALSWAYLILGDVLAYVRSLPKRGIYIDPQPDGLVNVDWAGRDPRQAVQIFKRIVAQIEQQGRPN